MAPLDNEHIEDLTECIAEGRTPRENGPYRIRIGDADLDFRPADRGRNPHRAADYECRRCS